MGMVGKHKGVLIRTLFFCAVIACNAWAGISGAPLPRCSEPLLITSAGQGPGCTMARLMIVRSGAVKTPGFLGEPSPEYIEKGSFKTIYMVIGASAKGLGASGITIEQELVRLKKVMEKAKKMGIQVIAVHIEGKTRRGKPGSADEVTIDAILPYASHIIVTKEADDVDKKFTNFGKQNRIPVTYLGVALDFGEAAKVMYSK